MALITMIRPLTEPKKLPVREDIEIKTAIEVKIAGACVIAAVAVFYVIFW
jgi:SSS family solute:Na+ symporter